MRHSGRYTGISVTAPSVTPKPGVRWLDESRRSSFLKYPVASLFSASARGGSCSAHRRTAGIAGPHSMSGAEEVLRVHTHSCDKPFEMMTPSPPGKKHQARRGKSEYPNRRRRLERQLRRWARYDSS
jgi:hypothetical protein